MSTTDRCRILERRTRFLQATLVATLGGCAERGSGAAVAQGTAPAPSGAPSASVQAMPSAADAHSGSTGDAPASASASEAPTVVVRACLTIIAPVVRFAPGSAALEPDAGGVMDEIATTLGSHPELRVALEAHRDAQERDAQLDERRGAAVEQYLAHRGVAAERMCVVGFDAERPVAPNDTEDGRARNRRVEFRAVHAGEACVVPPAKP